MGLTLYNLLADRGVVGERPTSLHELQVCAVIDHSLPIDPRGPPQVTQRFLDSAVLAKQQVQERCGGYHRVLYAITDDLGPANSTKAIAVAADLKALRATLGEDGVIALGPQGAWVRLSIVYGCYFAAFNYP